MEEKYDQIEMDIGDLKLTSDEPDSSSPEENAKKPTRQAEPVTLQIDNSEYEHAEEEIDDDTELISPDEEIFKRAANQIKNADEVKRSDMSEWTQAALNAKEKEKIEYNERFANTSRTEHDFMKAFGIADKTGKTVNIDSVNNPSTTEIETLQADIHSDYYEFTDRQQRKEIIGMYKYAKRSIRTKIIISAILALFLLLIENITLFSSAPTGIFNVVEHPYLHFFADFIIFILCAVCSYEQIYHGVKSIFSKEYIPESIAVFAVLSGILHSLFTIIFIPFSVTPKLYNFPSALICVLSLLFSYINVAREKYSFSIVSSKDTKFVLNKVAVEDAEAETEAFSTASKDFMGDLIRVDKADFVKRYFARTNKSASTAKVMHPYYILAILIPLVLSIISIFKGADFMQAMTNWYVGIMMVLPVGVLFTYSIPFFIGNKRLYEYETSIIGEETIEEFANAKAVSVNDTTAFPPYNVKLQNLNVYNDYKLEKVLYYAVSGFSTVGGPLADVFEVTTKDAFAKSKRARFVCSGRSYLCIKVDNDTIIFADRYGITSQGIEIPSEREEIDEDVSVMYMACNGKLCARMYIKYTIDEEFAEIVKSLNKNGVSVGIRSFDPNINNELLKRETSFKKVDLRVIRLTKDEDISKTYEKVDSGIVSKGLSKFLIKAIPVCKNIAKFRKVGTVVKIIASVIGATLLGMCVFGVIPLIYPLLIAAYYAVWMFIMFIISSVMILQ